MSILSIYTRTTDFLRFLGYRIVDPRPDESISYSFNSMDAIADKEVAELTRGLTPYMKLAGLGRARSQQDFDKMDKIAQDNLVNRFTAQLLPKKSYLKIIGRGTFRKKCLKVRQKLGTRENLKKKILKKKNFFF